jgi:16S rRNA (cytosine967-C5)-methyltransferase
MDKVTEQKRGLAARKLAMKVLVKIEEKGAYTNIALANALEGGPRNELSERDRAFVTALVQGVLRNKNKLDEILSDLSSQPIKKIQPTVLNLLRLALFQLDFMDIPQRAVVDTAVEISRGLGHSGISKFTNAVLRSHIRNKETREAAAPVDLNSLNPAEQADALGRQFSMPPWLVSRWLRRFGQEETQKLLSACGKPARLTLRVNDTAMAIEGYERILEDKGIIAERSELVPACLVIKDRKALKGPVEKLPGFNEGIFSVQDEAAAFVAMVVAPKAGDSVVDLCAAPGGKTLHMAELMENKGRIQAIDKHEGRLNLVKENRQRLGLTNIETKVCDGITFTCPAVDKVLVDAPCSGTGVINKRSDIRFKLTEQDIHDVTAIQRKLLSNAATLVKPGGYLVYSTCSIESEENEDVIDWFLESHPEFEPADMSDCFKREPSDKFALKAEAENGRVLFLPSRHEFSGFFVAKLKRQPG